MSIRLCPIRFRLLIVTALCALFLLSLPHHLLAYGGGGGGGGGAGGGDGSAGSSATLQPLTSQQITNIFGRVGKGQGLSSQTVENMVNIFKGKKIDPKQLYRIRQRMLEIEKSKANFWSGVWGGAVVIAETTDTVGKYTQFVLTFVPGVGWATNAGLSLARSGAEEYQKGGDAGQIAKAMTVDGVTSIIMKGSPLGNKGSNALKRAGQTFKASKTVVSKTVKKALIKRSKQHLIKGAALSGLNTVVGGQVKGAVGHTTTAIQNSIPAPSYSSSSSGGWGPHFAR